MRRWRSSSGCSFTCFQPIWSAEAGSEKCVSGPCKKHARHLSMAPKQTAPRARTGRFNAANTWLQNYAKQRPKSAVHTTSINKHRLTEHVGLPALALAVFCAALQEARFCLHLAAHGRHATGSTQGRVCGCGQRQGTHWPDGRRTCGMPFHS
jgi:hypothetical protein